MKLKKSLQFKTVLATLLLAIILGSTAVFVSYRTYKDKVDSLYKGVTVNVAETAAAMLDAQEVKKKAQAVCKIYSANPLKESYTYSEQESQDYYAQFDHLKDEGYWEIFKMLEGIKNTNNVRNIYISYVDIETLECVLILDANTSEDASPMGMSYSAPVTGYYDKPLRPEDGFPADIADMVDGGWVCYAGAPILDESNQVVAYVFVDVSMDSVIQSRKEYVIGFSKLLLVITLVLILIFIRVVNNYVVNPVKRLSKAASSYNSDRMQNEEGNAISNIEKLQIHTGDEIELLSLSLKHMEQEISEYIKNLADVTAEKERISTELNVATHIQASMLPCIFPAFPERPELDIYASMLPAREVGGDFYDFFLIDDDRLAIVIADVSGKGVPAALFMVIAKTLIKNVMQTGLSPKDVLNKVNDQLCMGNKAEMFVTVWLGSLEISTGKLIYANAGHEYPAIKRANGSYELIKDKHDFVLAGMEGLRYRDFELQMNPGDRLFLYTDGVVEAMNVQNKLYGSARLTDALNCSKDKSCEELIESIKHDIDAFVEEAPQFDDITMLSLELRACDAFGMKKLKLTPALEAITQVTTFVEDILKAAGIPIKVIIQMNVAVDEIFSNIVRYAGATDVTVGVLLDDKKVTLRFADNGLPYNPTERVDPDVTISAEEREIGGLGFFMVKKTMDTVAYQYHNGLNILTLTKSD